MKITTVFYIRLLSLGCIIPIAMSVIVYQGFSTNYTTNVFSKQGFEDQYENGIYKYRVLGRIIHLKTYDLVKEYGFPIIAPRSLNVLDKDGDRQFFSAYFYMNTYFLCLASTTLFLILSGPHKNIDFVLVDLPLLFMCSLMAITQYVIVPYDTLSYFFLSVAVLLIIHGNQTLWNSLALCVIVVLATLTRETAILILVFYFAINYKTILTKPTTFKINQEQGVLLIITVCFICTYVGLRGIYGFEQAIYHGFGLFRNASLFSILSILFLVSIVLIVFLTKVVTKDMAVFFITALAYIVPMFLFANLWEIRLWTPFILLLVIMKVRAAQPAIPHNISSTVSYGVSGSQDMHR